MINPEIYEQDGFIEGALPPLPLPKKKKETPMEKKDKTNWLTFLGL